MTARSYAFLFNPFSGSGHGRRLHDALPAELARLGVERWTSAYTRPDEIAEQVREALATHDRIIVAGGDGTIGQALEGLLLSGRQDAALGAIPLGTGNDMARQLSYHSVYLERGAFRLIELFLEDRTRPIDLWRINGGRIMANYVSLGLDARTTTRYTLRRRGLTKPRRAAWNRLHYALAGIQSLGYHIPRGSRLHLERDGRTTTIEIGGRRTAVLLNIATYGGGFEITEGVRPDDGLLDVVVFSRFATYLALLAATPIPPLRRMVSRLLLAPHLAERATVEWSDGLYLQIDGECRDDLARRSPLTIERAGQVNMLAGPE